MQMRNLSVGDIQVGRLVANPQRLEFKELREKLDETVGGLLPRLEPRRKSAAVLVDGRWLPDAVRDARFNPLTYGRALLSMNDKFILSMGLPVEEVGIWGTSLGFRVRGNELVPEHIVAAKGLKCAPEGRLEGHFSTIVPLTTFDDTPEGHTAAKAALRILHSDSELKPPEEIVLASAHIATVDDELVTWIAPVALRHLENGAMMKHY